MNGFQGNPLEMVVLENDFQRQQQQKPFSAHSATWSFGANVPFYKGVYFFVFISPRWIDSRGATCNLANTKLCPEAEHFCFSLSFLPLALAATLTFQSANTDSSCVRHVVRWCMQTEIKEQLELLKTLRNLSRSDNARRRLSTLCGVAIFKKERKTRQGIYCIKWFFCH